jgi:hypothetical protein
MPIGSATPPGPPDETPADLPLVLTRHSPDWLFERLWSNGGGRALGPSSPAPYMERGRREAGPSSEY